MQSAKRTTTCELIQRRQARLESGLRTAADSFHHHDNLQDTTSVARVAQGSQAPRGVLLELHQGTVDQTSDHTRAGYHLWAYLSDMSQCCIWQ
jgi:hypothetical protein